MAISPVLAVHIAAGGLGLLAGVGALVFRKGGRLHRTAGLAFLFAMLVMAGLGAYLGIVGPLGVGAALAALLAVYLVLSGWMTARFRERRVGWPEIASLVFAIGVVAALVMFIMQVRATPAVEAGARASASRAYGVLVVAALAALLDLSVILRRGVSGAHRIARHLWRVCMSLFLATLFFFPGQPDIFVGVPVLVLAIPPLAVLAVMMFWEGRTLLTKQFRSA